MAKPDEIIGKISPFYAKKKGTPSADFKLSYNSSSESLEPIYFWILDFMGGPEKTIKIVDNFQSSPGSGHFSELMGKATRMQEEGMKMMQTVGAIIKSVINIIYDLRQFEIRLNDYNAANGKKGKDKIEPGVMALKQTWLDNVDIKRGNSSIKAMTFSQQGAFVTLLNAFMAAKSLADIKSLDLNDIVKRVLEQRMLEFEEWVKLSESELRKRYNIQRHWLKSQVDALKMYSRWAGPYFKAAEELRMSDMQSAGLVKAFNSIILNLVIMKKDGQKIQDLVYSKQLPQGFEKLKAGKDYRNFYSCVLVDFTFRGIPQKVEQHYGFGGKSDVNFKAFALNQDELDLFQKKLEESDINEALKMVESLTGDSLREIQKDIDYFLKDVEERENEKAEENEYENVNPFMALFGISGKSTKKDKSKDEKDKIKKAEKERLEKLEKSGIKPDNYYEKLLRAIAEIDAKKGCYNVYDIYKKAHGMASVPFGDLMQREEVRVSFWDLFKR
jgi:hypothetical protein